MLRTRNLIQKVNDTTQYNTAVQQIGGIQRARYKVLNNQFSDSYDMSETVRKANYYIYEQLYNLQREVLILEAHIFNYNSRSTDTCNSSCDACQTNFSVF